MGMGMGIQNSVYYTTLHHTTPPHTSVSVFIVLHCVSDMVEQKRKNIEGDAEKMEVLRRNIEALKKVSEELNTVIENDIDDIEGTEIYAKDIHTQFSTEIGKMKRISSQTFTMLLVVTALCLGGLLFIAYLIAK